LYGIQIIDMTITLWWYLAAGGLHVPCGLHVLDGQCVTLGHQAAILHLQATETWGADGLVGRLID